MASNSTVHDNETCPQQVAYRVVSNTLGGLCLFFGAWIFIAFICYAFRKRKFSRRRRRQQDSRLYIFAIFSSMFNTVFLICCMLAYNYGPYKQSDEVCDVLGKLAVMLSICASTNVYLFIWMRQKIIYESPALDEANTKVLRFFRNAAIIVMITGIVAQGILYVTLNNFKFHKNGKGCGFEDDYNAWPAFGVSCLNVVCQGTMLFLFLYPFGCIRNQQPNRQTIRILVRFIIATVVCMLSDASSGIYVGLIAKDTFFLPLSVYAFSGTLNVGAVLLTYGFWPEIMMSLWRCTPLSDEAQNSQRSFA